MSFTAAAVSPAPIATVAAAPTASSSARLTSLDALRGFTMFWILGGDFIVTTAGKMSGGTQQSWTFLVWIAGLVFCFVGPRIKVLAGIVVAILVGYWALMNFVPIRDVQLTRTKLAELAEKSGDINGAIALRSEANPSATRNSPAWRAAEELF